MFREASWPSRLDEIEDRQGAAEARHPDDAQRAAEAREAPHRQSLPQGHMTLETYLVILPL